MENEGGQNSIMEGLEPQTKMRFHLEEVGAMKAFQQNGLELKRFYGRPRASAEDLWSAVFLVIMGSFGTLVQLHRFVPLKGHGA